ncbi:hypothetical protein FBZ85_10947 [Azospirillum brasilense]|uniref:Uncharacterized protein n=1 Tax=Azospirillum baldaniorum TaxID=1064539 RepID=A0A9P1NQU7_9PROT|nr:hypothetical protein FBZ84_112215 [Azospirillum baldaniorum]TWA76144.1 hypothetical protein FBZ85_10947 [Azospirillum brasilense]CCD02318.1 protein of unknown function [Azospirillum baldaniorum]
MRKNPQAFIQEPRKAVTALKRDIVRVKPGRHDNAGHTAKTALRERPFQ